MAGNARTPTQRREGGQVTQLTFEEIHEIGSRYHPVSWFNTNRVAASSLWDSGLRVDDPEVKRAVSLVVLRVLDHVEPRVYAKEGKDAE